MAHVVTPAQVISRDLDLCWFIFGNKIAEGLAAATKAGLRCDVYEAWRSPERQAGLFAQGRTAPGNIVSWSEAWMSWHQYGCAADIVFKDAKNNWTWDGPYEKLAPIMKAQGLEWLGPKDKPHFQLTGGMTVAEARQICQKSGVQLVWANIITRLSNVTRSATITH